MKLSRICMLLFGLLVLLQTPALANPNYLRYVYSVEAPDNIIMGDKIKVTLVTREISIEDAVVYFTLKTAGGSFAPVGESVGVRVEGSGSTFEGEAETPGNGWGTWVLSEIRLNVKYSDGETRTMLITYNDLKGAGMDLSFYADNDLDDDIATPVTTGSNSTTLARPSISSPADDASLSLANVTVRWGSVTNATKYAIKVRDLDDYTDIIPREELTQTSYTINSSKLKADHEYEVTVEAKNNTTTKSTTSRFKIKTTTGATTTVPFTPITNTTTTTPPRVPDDLAAQMPVPLKIGETAGKLTDLNGHWAKPDIMALIAKGHVGGYPDGSFKPNNSITRAEFIKILVSALNKTSTDSNSGFKDVTKHWAAKEIAAAKKAGITDGYADKTFKPNNPITRAEIVSMINNAKKLSAGSGKIFFSDVKNNHWARAAILTAASNGIVSGYPDLTFKPNKNATRAEACKMIVVMLGK